MILSGKIVYIAGPITSRLNTYRQSFAEAEQFLVNAGAIVLNPAMLPLGLRSHESYMNICLPMVREADVLVLLPGWQDSKGTQIEAGVAEQLGMPLHSLHSILDCPESHRNSPI